jgi:hypothetical protein
MAYLAGVWLDAANLPPIFAKMRGKMQRPHLAVRKH